MNTAIFLISFSGFLYTQMVLYRISVTELNLCSSSYFVGSVGFPTYRTMSAETVTAFRTWMPLISFSGLVSSIVWNVSGKSKPRCLVPDLGGASSLSLMRMMPVVGFCSFLDEVEVPCLLPVCCEFLSRMNVGFLSHRCFLCI